MSDGPEIREVRCNFIADNEGVSPTEVAFFLQKGGDPIKFNMNAQGGKAKRALMLGLVLAKYAHGHSRSNPRWQRLATGAPALSWPSALVQNIIDKPPTWWTNFERELARAAGKRVGEFKQFDYLPFRRIPTESGEKPKRFAIDYEMSQACWDPSKLRCILDGEEQTDLALLDLAWKLERGANGFESCLVELPRGRVLSAEDITRLSLVAPEERRFLEVVRRCVQAGADLTAQFGRTADDDQAAVVESYRDLIRWLNVTSHRRAVVAGQRSWISQLNALANRLQLPPPLIHEMAVEMVQKNNPPPANHGYRGYPLLDERRRVKDSVVLQLPLLDLPLKLSPNKPIVPRAFMGWLKVEKVPVPKSEDGSPIWQGGCIYPAPAFALLDQLGDWRAALKLAESFARTCVTEGSSPQEFDFRWSLGRTDGGTIPPLLRGGHVALPFAIGLLQAAGKNSATGIDLTGVAFCAGLSVEGRLETVDWFNLLRDAALRPQVPATIALLAAKGQPGLEPTPLDVRCVEAGFATFDEMLIWLADRQHTRYRWPALERGHAPMFPEEYVSRPRHEAALKSFLQQESTGFFEMRLDVGEGKTTFLNAAVRATEADFRAPIAYFVNPAGTDLPEQVASSLADRLRRKYGFLRPAAANSIFDFDSAADLSQVLAEVSHLLASGASQSRTETIYFDAPDQVDGPVLPGLFSAQLPGGIRVVITSRPFFGEWRSFPGVNHQVYPLVGSGWTEAVEQQRKDAADFLGRIAAGNRYPGDERFGSQSFIQEVCFGDAQSPPSFMTVVEMVRRDRRRPDEPLDAASYRHPPRRMLLAVMDEALWRAQREYGLSARQFWQTLALPAIWRDENGVARELIEQLNPWREDQASVVYAQLPTANLFEEPASDWRYQLRHPDMRRLILGELTALELRNLDRSDSGVGLSSLGPGAFKEIHGMLSTALLAAWSKPDHPLGQYALKHLVAHLRAAQDWSRLNGVLCDFGLPLAWIASGNDSSLREFALTRRALSKPNTLSAADRSRLMEDLLCWESFYLRHLNALKKAPTQLQKPLAMQWARNSATSGPVSDAGAAALARETTPVPRVLRYRRPAFVALRPILAGEAIHCDGSITVSPTPDDRHVFLAGKDGRMHLANLSQESRPQTHSLFKKVHACVFIPDGTRALTGGEDGFARLWDFSNEKMLGEMELGGPIERLALSADGRFAASLLRGGIVQVWNPASWQIVFQFEAGHEANRKWQNTVPWKYPILPVEGRGRMLREITQTLADGTTETVRVYQRDDLEESIRNDLLLKQPPFALSGNGRRLYTGGIDGIVRVWDAEKGRLLEEWKHPDGAPVNALASSFDGNTILSAWADGAIYLWSQANEPQFLALKSRKAVFALAMTSDGRRAASAGLDGWVTIWDLVGQAAVDEFKGPAQSIALAISRDGDRVVSAGGRSASFWNFRHLDNALVVEHEGIIYDVAIEPDGRHFLTVGGDGFVRLWDSEGAATANGDTSPKDRAVTQFAAGQDGRRIVSLGGEQTARAWVLSEESKPVDLEAQTVWDIEIAPDGETMIGAGGGGIFSWTLSSGKMRQEMPPTESSLRLVRTWQGVGAFSSDKNVLRVYQWPDWSVLLELPAKTKINCLTLTPDKQYAVLAWADGTIDVWDLTRMTVRQTFVHGDRMTELAVTPDSRHIVSAGINGRLRIWDLHGINPNRELPQPSKYGRFVLSPDGETLLTLAPTFSDIHVWRVGEASSPLVLKGPHVASEHPLEQAKDFININAVASNNRQASAGTRSGMIVLWDLSTGNLLNIQPSQSGSEITALAALGNQIVCGCRDGSVEFYEFLG